VSYAAQTQWMEKAELDKFRDDLPVPPGGKAAGRSTGVKELMAAMGGSPDVSRGGTRRV
jgi:hypothetical protein